MKSYTYFFSPLSGKIMWYHISLQDRRWNADKPSVALDPYIPTWLTTSPAYHRPANFSMFFLNIGRKFWKVVQSQVQLMSINFPFSDSLKYR